MASFFVVEELEELARPEAANNEVALRLLIAIQTRLDREIPLPPEQVDVSSLPVVFDIFLSYRSTDAMVVLGLYHWLTRRGYFAYLDSLDISLPNPASVNRRTADILRKRMVQSQSLFVITTQDMPSSAWVPWELGFTDGLTGKAAVLYIADRSNVAFNRQSYFALYAEVQRDNAKSKPFDLHINDTFARPALHCDWGHWLKLPKRY
jgi:hypothetical protein